METALTHGGRASVSFDRPTGSVLIMFRGEPQREGWKFPLLFPPESAKAAWQKLFWGHASYFSKQGLHANCYDAVGSRCLCMESNGLRRELFLSVEDCNKIADAIRSLLSRRLSATTQESNMSNIAQQLAALRASRQAKSLTAFLDKWESIIEAAEVGGPGTAMAWTITFQTAYHYAAVFSDAGWFLTTTTDGSRAGLTTEQMVDRLVELETKGALSDFRIVFVDATVATVSAGVEEVPQLVDSTPAPSEAPAKSRARGPKTRNAKRDEMIYANHLAGSSYEVLAQTYGITRARVSQIVKAQKAKASA